MSDLDLFASAGDGIDSSHFGLTVDGSAYVVAGPFAKALGYRDAANAARLLDEGEKGTQIVSTPGGDQRVSVIFEDGIWELIFRSTLPSAKSIKSRVKAILRQLRETGVVDTREKPFTELELAERYVSALKRVADLEPAAKSWEQLADTAGDYSLREAAQILDRDPTISTGQNRLAKCLREMGWTSITGGLPYQAQVDNGRLAVRASSYEDLKTGERVPTRQIRITVKGLHELHKRLGGAGALLLSA
jgi:prophage antirepressor-like protein